MQDQDVVMDEKLVQELERLKHIQTEISTCEHSEHDRRVSFYERIEGRKHALRDTAQKVNINVDHAQSSNMYVRQPEHPFKAEERNILQLMAN